MSVTLEQQQSAYNRYRSAWSEVPEVSKVSVSDVSAIHPDFVEVMSRNYPRVFPSSGGVDLGENWNPVYRDWMTKNYTVLYEQGVHNMGPSTQIFQMSRLVDISRGEGGGYNWNSIVNEFTFDLWSLTNQKERIALSNVVCEDHGTYLSFVDLQGTPEKPIEYRVSFSQLAVPSGKVVWQFEYKIKGVVRMRLHLTEIKLV